MGLVDWGDAAAWAGVVAALVASAVAAWVASLARRQARRSADAAERSAVAAEEQVAIARAEAERYQVPWQLQQVSHQKVYLLNEGDEPEFDVSIQADFIEGAPVAKERVGAREAVEFYAIRTYDTADEVVTVRWRRQQGQGEWLEWRHPLP